MSVVAVGQIAELYNGLAVSGLLFLFLLIARFYQRQAGIRSGYQLFLVPAAAFLIAGIRYFALPGQIAGDMVADLLRLGGGIWLIGWGIHLLTLMTGKRQ